MLAKLDGWTQRAHRARWMHLSAINVRFLVGFALLPAGLKKILGQPFTSPDNHGPFHDFLHAFHATGFFYRFVGAIQLLCATLLITQRFAGPGALLCLPILTTILVFCWSTAVVPTATVVTLMFFATVGLFLWDWPRWRRLGTEAPPPFDATLWELCGVAILVAYLGLCAATGEVYRPKGADRKAPGFYVLAGIALLPFVTLAIDRRRHRRHARTP